MGVVLHTLLLRNPVRVITGSGAMNSLHCPSQSCWIDHGAPDSTHNDSPGRSGLRLPQEGQDNVEKPIFWILVLTHNRLDIAWLDVQHQAQQASAVLRIQQFFKYPRRISFRQRIVNGRGCVRMVSTLDWGSHVSGSSFTWHVPHQRLMTRLSELKLHPCLLS